MRLFHINIEGFGCVLVNAYQGITGVLWYSIDKKYWGLNPYTVVLCKAWDCFEDKTGLLPADINRAAYKIREIKGPGDFLALTHRAKDSA